MLSLPRPSGTRPILGCCSRPSRVPPMSPCLHSWVCVPPSLLTPERLSSHSCVQICTKVLTGQAPVGPYTLGIRGLLDSQPVLLTGASSQPLVSPIRPAHISCVYLLHSWAPRLPWSTVPCSPVSSNHPRVCGSLLCKCHAPTLVTRAPARVCPMSTPRTMFSQGPLPALPPLGGIGGEGAGCSTNRNVLPVHF